jgi:hypothetical protein
MNFFHGGCTRECTGHGIFSTQAPLFIANPALFKRHPKKPDPLFQGDLSPLGIADALFVVPGPANLPKFLGAKKVTFRKFLFLTSYKTNASNITCPSKNNTSFTFLDITKQRTRRKINGLGKNETGTVKTKPAINFLDFKNTANGEKKTHQGEQRPDQ